MDDGQWKMRGENVLSVFNSPLSVDMKRSWFPILIVAAVLGLLTLFLGLQYQWLSQASDAERERMQKRVEADTVRFAEDFNREIQSAYFNFQIDAGSWKRGDWSEFNERYDYWKGKTAYPELIREFVFLKADDNAVPLKYNSEERVFESTAITAELSDLKARLRDASTFKNFYEDAFALAMPVYEGEKRIEKIVLRSANSEERPVVQMPQKFGYLVILLDRSTVSGRILHDLNQKYFPAGDYHVVVTDKSGRLIFQTQRGITAPDATASLLDLSPDNLLFFAGRDAIPRSEGGQRRDVVVNQRVESHTFSQIETESGEKKSSTFKIELQPRTKSLAGEKRKPRTMIASKTSNDDLWNLQVQHAAGSIDSYITGERNKSFLIGLGVYVLLVGSILAIVISALRSKRFAQRQIDFVSSVSHEFRTPLAVIYSAGENLADGVAKDESQISKYGNLIKGEGKKLSGMVEQILEFAGANSGRKKYNFAQTDVAAVVQNALAECKSVLEEMKFEVETNIAAGLPAINADGDALSTAIQNLILNSTKYGNGSNWLRVSAENGGGKIKISVEDRGIGIASRDLKQIFEPFYRSKEVVDAQIHGNGLGLSLVKEIAEAHGGKASVESRHGAGSRFVIELPQG